MNRYPCISGEYISVLEHLLRNHTLSGDIHGNICLEIMKININTHLSMRRISITGPLASYPMTRNRSETILGNRMNDSYQ